MRTSEAVSVSTPARWLTAIAALTLLCALLVFASPAFAAVYDPLNIIAYDTWRASNSMSVADIQAFLDTKAGPLKTLVTKSYVNPGGDHGTPRKAGQPAKSAAQIIYEAATYWNINPKVILATLQKEQSLIEVSNSSNTHRLAWAVGYDCYDHEPKDGVVENGTPGFGAQVYNGTRVFSQYETLYKWYPGKPKAVSESKETTRLVGGKIEHYHRTLYIVPANACTYGLYTYTPWFPQKLFWSLYMRYFGDPQTPPRLRPVYSFRNRTTLAYYYTSSEGQRYAMLSTHGWIYVGAAFTIDASSTANLVPLYRLRNNATGYYAYTVYPTTRDGLLAKRSWVLSGTVGLVSKVAAAGAIPIYKLENKHSHKVLFTQYASTVTRLTKGHTATFWNRGIGFYLGRSVETTTPVGP
jgi:hypothetical protein